MKSTKVWGYDIMARIYANLIKKGLKTIDDVPEKIRDDVLYYLEE